MPDHFRCPPRIERIMSRFLKLVLYAVTFAAVINSGYAQDVGSFPHAYPGQPHGDFSPAWQDCTRPSLFFRPSFKTDAILILVDFQVKDPLPNVTFPLGRNWAGNLPVGRHNQPNDTLFFWGFEKENGSFTANSTEPWGI